MFGKSQIKLITSLAQKKYRQRHQLFIAEGNKVVSELLKSDLKLHSLYCTQNFYDAEPEKVFLIEEKELKKISQLKTPQNVLAVFHIPGSKPPGEENLILALDEVRDPGNLGTIIRLCDWFGIKDLVCSLGTADCYNPKVVQASMGSISRVNIIYTGLGEFLKNISSELPVFGTFMEGKNIYRESLPKKGIIVFGNEGKGISPEVSTMISNKISIPQFGRQHETESLNVATATAIVLSEFRRGSEVKS